MVQYRKHNLILYLDIGRDGNTKLYCLSVAAKLALAKLNPPIKSGFCGYVIGVKLAVLPLVAHSQKEIMYHI